MVFDIGKNIKNVINDVINKTNCKLYGKNISSIN